MSALRSPFLTAEWRWLMMANYAIDPELLSPYVPVGTELDCYEGSTYVSLVGFQFLNTRVLGLSLPGHRDFDEVNLRFYVRRREADGWRRGVVFLKEVVARRLISWVARTIYHENYVTRPVASRIQIPAEAGGAGSVRYQWGDGITASADFSGESAALAVGGFDEFIAEHYWGYTRRRDGKTLAYEVAHPSWKTWSARNFQLTGDLEALYGPFANALQEKPASVFVADGSAVSVSWGQRLSAVMETDPFSKLEPAAEISLSSDPVI